MICRNQDSEHIGIVGNGWQNMSFRKIIILYI
jgi:hypothetical protein